jgi:orotidine-5'-phosphate decarboxylase
MGTDSLKALIPWMKNGRRIYIVWVSSNKSGREIQLRPAPFKKTPIAEIVRQDFTKLAKKENVLGQLGWVLGATGLTETFIKQLPKQPQKFLLPGVGAQGATFDEITAKLIKKHPESLFPISRGILRPNPDDRISAWTDYSKIVQKNWQKFLLAWSESVR